MKTSTRIVRNMLSRNDFVRLVEWVRANVATFGPKRLSCQEAADRAAQDLGFPVTIGNLRGICSVSPKAIISYEWPGAKGHESVRGAGRARTAEQIATLTDAVRAISNELGIDLSGVRGWSSLSRRDGGDGGDGGDEHRQPRLPGLALGAKAR